MTTVNDFENNLINGGGAKAVRDIIFGILTGVYTIEERWGEPESSDISCLKELVECSDQNIVNYALNNVHMYKDDRDSFIIEIMEDLSIDMQVVKSMSAATSRRAGERLAHLLDMERLVELYDTA